MKFLKISNNGYLDPKGLYLLGATSKRNDEKKIGNFGSGLKFSIPFLIRNNIHFKIFIGEDEVEISTEEEEVNSEVYDVICVNGVKTSISTSAGVDWVEWDVVREIYCNAIDEGGEDVEMVSDKKGLSGDLNRTVFFIQVTKEIEEVWKNWSSYFVDSSMNVVQENSDFVVYKNNNEGLTIYKQGVQIYRDEDCKRAIFSYDVKDARINELRQFLGSPDYAIVGIIQKLNTEATKMFIDNIKDSYEYELDYRYMYGDMNKEAFNDSEKDVISKSLFTKLVESGRIESDRGLMVLPDEMYNKVRKFDNVTVHREVVSILSSEFFRTGDREVVSNVNNVFHSLKDRNIDLEEMEFVVGIFMRKDQMFDIKGKKVYLSEELASRGLHHLSKKIIYFNEIIKYGMSTNDLIGQIDRLLDRIYDLSVKGS